MKKKVYQLFLILLVTQPHFAQSETSLNSAIASIEKY